MAVESSIDPTSNSTNTYLAANNNNALLTGGFSGLGTGLYGSPLYGNTMMMGGGPFSGVYQVLWGVQNVIFSLHQVVQLLGTNQQALQQIVESLTNMVDKALSTFSELRALQVQEEEQATEAQRKRRSRLKALRWAMLASASWLVYKLLRRLSLARRRRRLTYPQQGGGGTLLSPSSYYTPSVPSLYPSPNAYYPNTAGPYTNMPLGSMGMTPGSSSGFF